MEKNAIVTGGAQGIGLSIVKILLQNNYNVAVCDLNSDVGIPVVQALQQEFQERKCLFYLLDISKREEFEVCIQKIKSNFSKIHLLVNNAGIANDDIQFWEKEVDINCKGTVTGCLLGLKYLERDGIIINISSTTVFETYLLMPIYAMTKCAVVHLTTSLGTQAYFEKFGIKVMAILPGLTDTPILRSNRKRYLFPDMEPAIRENAMKQFGQPQSPQAVADGVIKSIQSGINGSLWVVRNNQPPKILSIKYQFSDPAKENNE